MQSEKSQIEASLAKQSLVAANNLQYSLKPDLSVCTSRTSTAQFFQNSQYSEGSNMTCILNTGSAYVFGRNSSLVLDVYNPSETSFTFGSGAYGGTAASLISTISVYTRSGLCVERIQSSHVLSALKMLYEHTTSYGFSVGQAAGLDRECGKKTTTRFVIPMSLISGLFDYDGLLPSSLMSGLRIQIDLNPSVFCLMAIAAGIPSYTIVACKIECDCFQLTDSVSRSLNEASASSGLEVVFNTWFSTPSTRNAQGGGTLNIESRRACSRALMAVYKEIPERSLTGGFTAEPLQSTRINGAYGPTSVQWRAGSLYFPNTVITAPNAELAAAENYYMTVKSYGQWDQIGGLTTCAPQYEQFVAGAHALAVDLERSDVLELAGIPLSNSRTLCLNAVITSPEGVTYSTNMFLKHCALIRVFISNATLEV